MRNGIIAGLLGLVLGGCGVSEIEGQRVIERHVQLDASRKSQMISKEENPTSDLFVGPVNIDSDFYKFTNDPGMDLSPEENREYVEWVYRQIRLFESQKPKFEIELQSQRFGGMVKEEELLVFRDLPHELRGNVLIGHLEEARFFESITHVSEKTGWSYPLFIASNRPLDEHEITRQRKRFERNIEIAEKPPEYRTNIFCGGKCVSIGDFPARFTEASAFYPGGEAVLKSIHDPENRRVGGMDFIIPERVLKYGSFKFVANGLYNLEPLVKEFGVAGEGENRWVYELDDIGER